MKLAIASRDMTPSVPCYLSGHASRTGMSEGILDRLYTRALVLEGNETVCWITLDVVMIDESYADDVRSIAAQKLGIAPSHVFISFLHNHSGPEFTELNVFTKSREHGAAPGYREWVRDLIEANLEDCMRDRIEVSAWHGQAMIEGFYGNRNDDALVADKHIDLIQFRDEKGKPVAHVLYFSCHSTVLGSTNYLISADLGGALRAAVEQHYGAMTCALVGACGDVSNRQHRQGNDAAELNRVAAGISKQIFDQVKWTRCDMEPIDVQEYTYVIDYTRDLKAVAKQVEATRLQLEAATDPGQIQLLTSGLAIQRGQLTEDPHIHLELKGALVNLGELVLVTIPAELFSRLGLAIKACLPDKRIWVVCYTNYSIGYMVEEAEWGKNYESLAASIQKGDPEAFTAYVTDLLQSAYQYEHTHRIG